MGGLLVYALDCQAEVGTAGWGDLAFLELGVLLHVALALRGIIMSLLKLTHGVLNLSILLHHGIHLRIRRCMCLLRIRNVLLAALMMDSRR